MRASLLLVVRLALPILAGTTFAACSSNTDSGPASNELGPSEDDAQRSPARSANTTSSSRRSVPSAEPAVVGTVDATSEEESAEPADAVPPADAGVSRPPAPAAPCSSTNPVVFGTVDATSAYRYSTSAAVPSGFSPLGAMFRLASPTTAEPHAPLYLLSNPTNGDYLVSTVPTEGSSVGYSAIGVIGDVYLAQVPGAVPLTRYLQESPKLRHRVSIDRDPGGWITEPPRGYVCPR